MKLVIHNAKREIRPEHDLVLITGDGRSLLNDLKEFDSWKLSHDTYCIGRSYQLRDQVMHWGNVDGPDSSYWAEHIASKYHGEMPIRHTLGECKGYDIDWDIEDEIKFADDDCIMWHGSTALFGVYTCMAMGYRHIILAGCPMDMKGHWMFPGQIGPRWHGEDYVAWFEFAHDPESWKVKSLSGYTAQILGKAKKDFYAKNYR